MPDLCPCSFRMGLIIPETQDGRVLFFLPWEGSTICGTTDAVSDITMTPVATIEDIDFILQESNKYSRPASHRPMLPALTPWMCVWVWARPQCAQEGRAAEGCASCLVWVAAACESGG